MTFLQVLVCALEPLSEHEAAFMVEMDLAQQAFQAIIKHHCVSFARHA